MKKTYASWEKEVYCKVDCPYCGNYMDIKDEFECEDYLGEFDEENLDGMEIECDSCHKNFGLSETIIN